MDRSMQGAVHWRTVTTVLAALLGTLVLPPGASGTPDAGTLPASAPVTLEGVGGGPGPGRLPAHAWGIGPGSYLSIRDAVGSVGCTADFLWRDGARTFIGTAGHCLLPDGLTSTHGPGADYDPARTTVRICDGDCDQGIYYTLGRVGYARQRIGSQEIGNDFGVVEVPTALLGQVRYTIPSWGGPSESGTVGTGQRLCHYGHGLVAGEEWQSRARTGLGYGSFGAFWQGFLAVSPGDSGAPLVACNPSGLQLQGRAATGIITHGIPGYAEGTTMERAVELAREAGLNVRLALGP